MFTVCYNNVANNLYCLNAEFVSGKDLQSGLRISKFLSCGKPYDQQVV